MSQSHFKNGHTAINNDPLTGWPSTAQTNKIADHIREFISKNWHLTIRELVDELSISVHTIMTHNLGMRHVLTKLVPQFLTKYKTGQHAIVCHWVLQCAKNGIFLPSIIIGDETQVDSYDPETKQMSQWKMPMSPQHKKPREVWSKGKLMLIDFSDVESLVHHEFPPQVQKMNHSL